MIVESAQISKETLSTNLLSKTETQWFVFYTCPRAEKIAHCELLKKDYEVFLPITKTLTIWKNRQKKWIEKVLFPSYIFVNTHQFNLYDIEHTPKIVMYIRTANKPAVIRQNEIDAIKKMLCLNYELTVEPTFYEGEKVRIIRGPLYGHEGVLLKQKGKSRFGIQLKEINQTVFIDICTSFLEKF